MTVLLLLATLPGATAQKADRIRAVETGLTPRVVVKGRPTPHYTIQERMKAMNVHGVSVAAIENYEIAWAKGYGLADVSTQQPVTADTLFLAGSISKPLTAAAVLSLVEQDQLKLDADVNSYLRSWKVPENEYTKDQKVTLRRILSHMAGLTVHGFTGYPAGSPLPTIPQILDGEKPANSPSVRVDLVPGSRYRYSGGGYTVAQLVLTDVTGEPFPALMKKNVLSKAGMQHSTYENPLPQRLASQAATGYQGNGDAYEGRYYTYPEMAAAGLWTTASDLARFVIAIQKTREGRAPTILQQTTVEEMLRPANPSYGLGFRIEESGGLKRFSHGGADAGFEAVIMAGFDGRGFVVLTNSQNGGRLAGEIAMSFAAAYGWPDKAREREALVLPAESLAKFAGEYDAARMGKIACRVEQDHLVLTVPSLGEVVLYAATPDTFFSLSGVPDIKFAPDGSSFTTGNVTAKRAKRE